ncbi:arsinothricin resistance N-acetyltransferase ArsN1 family B [Haloprofundus halophilus]|uniref:arsinothricin resistance N-acetyltransferase ArsN1 family B n=1 Tax=Haloprofundus halophilus TaxID=2283527 RepID=UPI000E43504D|nr:arsinothricin resistance N-acetyltransferase ArsN1 family B [Haloprofundus halophilus]
MIRLATPDDADGVRQIYEPFVRDTAVSFETTPPTEAEVEARIASTLESHPWLVCERDERVVGYAYAGTHRKRDAYRWSVDSSVYVADDARRRGVARGLYAALFGILEAQGYVNVYAGTTLPNPASVGFHRAMGFEPVGVYENVGYKLGEWHDVQWLVRTLRPHPENPDPPVALAAVRETAAFEDALAAGESKIDR